MENPYMVYTIYKNLEINEINKESLDEFISKIEEYELLKEYSKKEIGDYEYYENNVIVRIFFNSRGGFISDASKLKTIIENSNLLYEFIVIGYLSSCAFDLFLYNYKNVISKKVKESFELSFAHKSFIDITTSPTEIEKLRIKEEERRTLNELKWYKQFLSKEQLKMYKEGKDVPINKSFLEKIIKKLG